MITEHKDTLEHAPAAQAECKRCGACCVKGGPALHGRDMPVLKNGALMPEHLFTLRKGELAFENVAGVVAPLAEEMVKIKGRPGAWTCMFYEEGKGCGIYENRPLECRALACWDTAALEAVYATDRLTRFDLLAPNDAVRKFIDMHEQRCNVEELASFASQLDSGAGGRAAEAICDMAAFDETMRSTLAAKAGLRPDHLDFLFGRPLIRLLPGFGLEAKRVQGRFLLAPAARR